jgi:hypothetical protein
MVKAQAIIPERKVFYRERGHPPLLEHGITQVGTEGQVLDLRGAMAKNPRNVTDLKQKSPNYATKHGVPD